MAVNTESSENTMSMTADLQDDQPEPRRARPGTPRPRRRPDRVSRISSTLFASRNSPPRQQDQIATGACRGRRTRTAAGERGEPE